MSQPGPDQFSDFFEALHGHAPYSWQDRLAAMAAEGRWPDRIDLPTGCGKTACIDIALFALACQAERAPAERTAPRRIVFCVNRRVIVDEAHERALRIAKELCHSEADPEIHRPILAQVATALRRLAGTIPNDDSPPLDVLELRGGIYRDNRWARSAAQPTVVCTTLDQLGSRLLFRGYGVSPAAAPIQAALLAYDCLVLLDEAHISRPFQQTLAGVRRFLDPARWAEQPPGPRPMIAVPMTATPADDLAESEVIRLDAADREKLSHRLEAMKPARLMKVGDVASALVEQAGDEIARGHAAIGILVNRVATARAVYETLRDQYPDLPIELVIGAMRPIDRDEQARRLAPRVGPGRPLKSTETSLVVATQCLEVGADYDFDVLLTECAAVDALRQRFGRLNRAGRKIDARAIVVIRDKDAKPDADLDDDNPLDPLYGNALARTWNWLWERAQPQTAQESIPSLRDGSSLESPPPPTSLLESNPSLRDGAFPSQAPKARGGKAKGPAPDSRVIDFGIDAFQALLEPDTPQGQLPPGLLGPSATADAPVLFPAYLDAWCQTAPPPTPDPDVALFIHGPQRSEPDIQVCWRSDLVDDDDMSPAVWADIVALLPPSSAECMSLPLSRVRRWLSEPANPGAEHGDLLESAEPTGEQPDASNGNARPASTPIRGVLWRGATRSVLLHSPGDLRPGDTLVLPESVGGWDQLGHIPPEELQPREGGGPPGVDRAEDASETARDRRVLRLHPALVRATSEQTGLAEFLRRIADPDDSPSATEWPDLLRTAAADLPIGGALRDRLETLARHNPIRNRYPNGQGFVLTARRRMHPQNPLLPVLDDGDDEPSRGRRPRVGLDEHTGHVVNQLRAILDVLTANAPPAAFRLAAERHDWGKADDRFQALLRDTGRTEAWLRAGRSPLLLAKSDALPKTSAERVQASKRAGLPQGFRHEMLSVQLAETAGFPNLALADRDLILHLIAAHHGHARPFAPVVFDDAPPDVGLEGVAISGPERAQRPPHRLDSGIADRFWSLTRRFGWWGLAYLEALLRLADQQASAGEDAGEDLSRRTPEPAEAFS
jgi:CRISPR-associated endonuclease/helicase Cas3